MGKLYNRVDALTAEFFKITPIGTEIKHGGKHYAVRDNFRGRTAFKTCPIDRFELGEMRPERRQR